MGLNDLVSQEKMDTKIERREREAKKPQQMTFDRIEEKKDMPRCDLNKSRKPCPSCACLSLTNEEYHSFYDCPNPDCGTLSFKRGWNEWRPDSIPLGSVEVDGWEYE